MCHSCAIRLQVFRGQISCLLTLFSSSFILRKTQTCHVPIQLHAHNEYEILFVESVKQFWHQLFETVEQKSSKLNYMSLVWGLVPSARSGLFWGWDQVMVEVERSPIQMWRRGILITVLILGYL